MKYTRTALVYRCFLNMSNIAIYESVFHSLRNFLASSSELKLIKIRTYEFVFVAWLSVGIRDGDRTLCKWNITSRGLLNNRRNVIQYALSIYTSSLIHKSQLLQNKFSFICQFLIKP